MSREITQVVLAIEEEEPLSLRQLCRTCAVHAEAILAMVDEGILEPSGDDSSHWRFPAGSIRRAHRVVRLQDDLGVNLSGAALVLDLLDRIESLETRLRTHEVRRGSSDR